MPVAEPEFVVDAPDGGWPWQLELCWVTGVESDTRPQQKKYKVKCKLCSFGVGRAAMLPHKIGLHFRGVEGQGVKTCACRASKIEKDYPDFWQKLQRTKLKLKTSPQASQRSP